MDLEFSLYNHQDRFDFNEALWLQGVRLALPQCLAILRTEDAPLPDLTEVEFCFLDDANIAAIHDEFMKDPTPTDVITFHHGEIHISLETAHHQASRLQLPYDKEVLLYMIHGLLHLGGWVDYQPKDRDAMHAEQFRILENVWPQLA